MGGFYIFFSNFQAFCLALLPLAFAAPKADVAFTAFTHFGGASHGVAHHAPHAAPVVAHAVHAPVHAVHHAAPVVAHHAVHHAPVHHAVHHAPAYHQPAYAYEAPKHNCSVVDVVESAEVCTPAFATECADVELPIKKIIDIEICVYEYAQKTEETTAKTVEVTFNKVCNVQMVTVCQPTPGYGYHSYGHNYCKEVAQETCYNV